MKIILTDGTEIEFDHLVGIVPAVIVYMDAGGNKFEVRESMVRQIDPAPEVSLPIIVR